MDCIIGAMTYRITTFGVTLLSMKCDSLTNLYAEYAVNSSFECHHAESWQTRIWENVDFDGTYINLSKHDDILQRFHSLRGFQTWKAAEKSTPNALYWVEGGCYQSPKEFDKCGIAFTRNWEEQKF